MKDIENVNSNKNMKNNIHENVIAFLINKRKELGISQNKIALELGLSDQAVSNWERGLSFPDISFLGDIAKVLETNVLSLIEGKNVNLNLKPNLYFDIERFSKYLYKLRKSKLLKQIHRERCPPRKNWDLARYSQIICLLWTMRRAEAGMMQE